MIRETVFAGFVFMTLLGAFFAVWLKNVFYNALGLVLALFGVAALFIYLNCEFLAVMEVIIYIGAISIAIIFAIMLSHPGFRQDTPRSAQKILRSLLIAGLVFMFLRETVVKSAWAVSSPEGDYSMRAIGIALLKKFGLPFEVVSLVLLVAIIGALLLADRDDEKEHL